MKELIAEFSNQLKKAIEIGVNANLTPSKGEFKNVLISGLGGSGIGGTIVSQIVAGEAKLPINVNKGYFVPSYVGEDTLFIASSYSGDTEETINTIELAIRGKAKIVCISSGGKIIELAKQNKLDYIVIPGGMPPRACLGYSLTQLLYILAYYNIISKKFESDLKSAIALIDSEEQKILTEAQIVAQKLKGKLPVIYSTTYNEGIAIRFRQQINENAKMLCWHHVIPEMNHNELVGWREKHENTVVVIFRDTKEYERNNSRIEINKEVFNKYTSGIIEIYSKGNSAIEKAIYFIHLGDWVSYFLAESRGVDSLEVSIINHLKSELSKL